MKTKEVKYYGIHACTALFQKRKDDIITIFITQENIRSFSPILKWCAGKKKAYHIVTNEEMVKITDSMHHEGLAILAKEKPLLSLKEVDKASFLLYLDGVENPHNVGSIVRSMMHFGIPYLLGDTKTLKPLPPSACRIAQGGAEYISLIAIDPKKDITTLQKKGFSLFATSSHEGQSLYQTPFAKKTLLILGAEGHGVSSYWLSSADVTMRIPGTSVVESLNVSVAAGVFLGEYWRQSHL
ncbi:MAG: hypothetical protein JW769_00560 [Parachlamydiales bacterium]|nr:hypothetical protein [Parachlamydiales bacterium]